MPSLKSFDFYRKIPMDLTESTLQGAVLSTCAVFFMAILFVCELTAFMSPEVYSTVMLDTNQDAKLRINFNITMTDLPCEYATVDVLDVLGTNRVNVTKNIVKWHTDAEGKKVEFFGRNREQEELRHDDHHPSLDIAHADGEHAIPLVESNFNDFVNGNEFVMADFYAPWCIWCQRLAPTWEVRGKELPTTNSSFAVVKIDCVENRALCHDKKILAFPTIKFFKWGKPEEADYKKDRSLASFAEYAGALIDDNVQVVKKYTRLTKDHVGCMLSGFIMVNRVPGNFHIEAQSKHHTVNPALANVSHKVNHLSFGSQFPMRNRVARGELEGLLEGNMEVEGEEYSAPQLHSAPHHYIKVVSTFLGREWASMNSFMGSKGLKDMLQYQFIMNSQVMPYEIGAVPEAKFSYDLSPMCVHIKTRGRKWYDFITSVLAIVGGTFSLVGFIDGVLFRIVKQKRV
ncbi:unnamed protein product [Chrysoparadoxa australica]